MALYSVRLDEASEEALTAAARRRKVTRAVILREAIAEYGKGAGRESTPFERMSSLIGAIQDGPGNLSEQTGRKFASLLAAARVAKQAHPAATKRAHTKRRVH